MQGYQSTASWGAAHMRRLDWGLRHMQMSKLKERRPRMHKEICERMSPDELLEGHNMPVMPRGYIIVLRDAKVRPPKAKAMKQTNLEDFHFEAKKKGLKQMPLNKYFNTMSRVGR